MMKVSGVSRERVKIKYCRNDNIKYCHNGLISAHLLARNRYE